MANRRAVKTKKEIKAAFVELLSEKKIEKITVAEITELADISRATFYLHFEDVYKLYESVEEDIFSQLILIFTKQHGLIARDALIKRLELSLEYIEENKQLITSMAENGNIISRIHKGAVNVFLNEFYQNGYTEFGFIEVNFVTWGLIGTLQDWIVGEIKSSKEELVDMLRYTLSRFIPDAS